MLLGGDFQNDAQVMVGPVLRACAAQFYVNKLFIGADGYSPKLGFMASNHLRVQAVRDMAEQAERVIVVTESSKFERMSTVPLALPRGVYGVITDQALSPAEERMLEDAGVRIFRAETEK